MPTGPNPPNPKERVATYVYFCSLYFVTVGVLYLWGYWSPFNINILEYLDLADIIKSTAYPIATALLLTAIGAAIGDGLVDQDPTANGNGVEAQFWRKVRKHMSVVVFAYVAGTVVLFAFAPAWKWQALPVLLALPLYAYAKHQNMLASVIPNESPRSIVLYVIAVLPFLAFGRGTLTADKVISGSEFTYATSEIPGYVAGSVSDPASLPRVVGRAGDRMFLFDPRTASLIIFKPDGGKSIVVKAFKAPTTQAPAAGPNLSLKGTAAGKPASTP